MIKYGLYEGLPTSPQDNNKSTPLLAVRVVDIILDNSHPDWEKYGGWDSLGLIKFVPYYSDDLKGNTKSFDIAKPLLSNIKNYPLLYELTYVISLPDPSSATNPNLSSYYYTNTVNLWNHPHHNAFPNIDYSQLPENTKLNYQEIESGLVKQQSKEDPGFKLGNTFKENAEIQPLLPFEGDVIFEGRYGQSIRFGSTVKGKNSWSSQGEEGSPITIIRNGQSPNKDKKGWIPTLEDINNDDNGIYLCSGQAIPINVASKNLKSFSSVLQEIKSPIIQISDNPALPTTQSSTSQDQATEKAETPTTTSVVPSIQQTSSVIPSIPENGIYTEDEIIIFPGEETAPIFIFQVDEIEEESNNIEITPESYNKDILMNESPDTKNEKGEYALYQNGKLIEYSSVIYIDRIRVAKKYEQVINLMLTAAKKETVPIKINSSLRTFDEQLVLRKQNIKDKTKVDDRKFLTEAVSSQFSPATGRPGFSNHQNGRAFDFNTATPGVYKWLVANALKYGFVRTVPSERWHWEYIPNAKQFAFVPQSHPTWDNLV